MNKKTKINIIIVAILVLLVVSVLMIRFEINPFSYLVVGNKKKEETKVADNLNGFYRFRESLGGTYNMFDTCVLSYVDNYILIVNDHYSLYRSSCIGTLLLEEGNTKDLKFKESKEGTKYILKNDVQYIKNDTIKSIKVGNNVKDMAADGLGNVAFENYAMLLEEAIKYDENFSISRSKFKSTGQYAFTFKNIEEDLYLFELWGTEVESEEITPLYSFNATNFSNMPKFRMYGRNALVLESIATSNKYSFGFKLFSEKALLYDVKTYFPITINSHVLTAHDSIYIKHNVREDYFTMIVGKDKEFCVEKSDKTDPAYYVFKLKYNYKKGNFDAPEFIKIVYKNEGCNYLNSIMEG